MSSDAFFDVIANTIVQKVVARVQAVADKATVTLATIRPVLLSVKDAAVYLGRSKQSLQHLIFRRELPVVRAGRRVHLDRRDLDAWIEKNKC